MDNGLPSSMVTMIGTHSKPGTRLKVLSFGTGSKPCGESVRTVTTPLGFVIEMTPAEGCPTVSEARDTTGTMNCNGDAGAVAPLAVAVRTTDVSVSR